MQVYSNYLCVFSDIYTVIKDIPTTSGCESLYLFPSALEEGFADKAEQELIYEYNRISLEVILLLLFFLQQ